MNIADRLLASVGGLEAFAASFAHRSFYASRHLSELRAGVQEAENGLRLVASVGGSDELQEDWLAGFVKRWGAYQRAGARCANWAVVGPARFPVERNRRRIDVADKRLAELVQWVNGAANWARKVIEREEKQRLGAVGILQRDLADARQHLLELEAQQAYMRLVNAAVRKAMRQPELERAAFLVAQLEPAGIKMRPALAAQYVKRDELGRAGFADYQLRNNLANIKRYQARVAELERRAAQAAEAEAEDAAPRILADRAGVQVVENLQLQRLQILFPGKPAPDVRQALKSRGFRWAPSEGAWQRQLGPNASAAAAAVLQALEARAA